MIVTCPSCTARYKINASKIKGRGAKITCPKCSHRFVVYRDGEGPKKAKKKRVPENVASWDFRTLGLTWRVRRGNGTAYDFFDLNTLRSFLDEGQVEIDDVITYDNRDWSRLSDVSDLDAFFYDVWEKAKRGEVSIAAPEDEHDDEDEDDEDDADAPTTIVGRGSELANELRQAVAGLGTPEAVTRETIPHPEGRGKTPGPTVESAGILLDEGTPVPIISSPSFTAPAPMEAGGVAEVFSAPPQPAKPSAGIGDTLGLKPAPLSVTSTPKPVQRVSAPTPPPAPTTSKTAPAKKEAGGGPNYTLIALSLITLVLVAAIVYFGFIAPNNTPASASQPTPAPAAAPAPTAPAPAEVPAEEAAPEGAETAPEGTEAAPKAAPAPTAAPAPAAEPVPAPAAEPVPAPAAEPAPVPAAEPAPAAVPEAAATEAPPPAPVETPAPEPAPETAPETPPSAPAEGGG